MFLYKLWIDLGCVGWLVASCWLAIIPLFASSALCLLLLHTNTGDPSNGGGKGGLKSNIFYCSHLRVVGSLERNVNPLKKGWGSPLQRNTIIRNQATSAACFTTRCRCRVWPKVKCTVLSFSLIIISFVSCGEPQFYLLFTVLETKCSNGTTYDSEGSWYTHFKNSRQKWEKGQKRPWWVVKV